MHGSWIPKLLLQGKSLGDTCSRPSFTAEKADCSPTLAGCDEKEDFVSGLKAQATNVQKWPRSALSSDISSFVTGVFLYDTEHRKPFRDDVQ